MSRVRIVARETFKNQMKSPSFWIMLLLPIVIMAISLGVGYFASKDATPELTIATEDAVIREMFETNGYETVSNADLDQIIADEENPAYAKLAIEDGTINADLHTADSPMQDTIMLQSLIDAAQMNLNRENAKLGPDQAEILARKAIVTEVTDDKTDKKAIGMIAYYILLFLMYMVLISFIQIIITETATEKGSKMIEFIFSSVRPGDYFKGKIFGNFLAAMIEIVAYAVFGIIGFYIASSRGIFDGLNLNFVINAEMILMVVIIVVLFLLGILIALILAGMLGSFANKVEDAGKFGSPLIFVIVAIFFLANFLMNKGDILATKILSYIPFTSTFIMPLRLINGYATITESLIAIAILILAIILAYKFGERVYKKNILNYSTESIFSRKKK